MFYFLPIMVAYNAAKKLKVDPWLGGAIMAMLMTPQFTGLMDAKTTTCVENAALGTKSCTANIFGHADGVERLQRQRVRAAAHGRRARPRLPRIEEDDSLESVQLVFVPFFCTIIVGALTAFIIGPIGGVGRQRPRRRPRPG